MAIKIRKMITGCGTLLPTLSTTSKIRCIAVFGASVVSLIGQILSAASFWAPFGHNGNSQGDEYHAHNQTIKLNGQLIRAKSPNL
jgi:hypothetical protein